MYKNILVPMAADHRPHTGDAMSIARVLLSEGGTITAFTVLEAIPSYVAQHIPEGVEASNRAAALASLKAETAGAGDVKVDVVYGHAGRTILEYAEEHGADLIVVSSHRPGLQDYFLGSTATHVVRHAPCAVHVVR